MKTTKRRILSLALALVLAFSAFSGAALAAPPQNSGLTSDKGTYDNPTYTPEFDQYIASGGATVTFRAVPTIIYTDTPSGYATAAEADAVEWELVDYTGSDVTITNTAAVQAQNYNAPDGFYASQVTISVSAAVENITIPISAQNGNNYANFTLNINNNGAYTQVALDNAPSYDDQITVYLNIDTPQTSIVGGIYFDVNLFSVELEPDDGSQVFYVSDVLVAAAKKYPQLEFLDGSDDDITADSNYVNSVTITAGGVPYNFAPDYNYSYYNGWQYRINDMFPMLAYEDWPDYWTADQGPVGAAINEAYVKNGNVIDLYFADTEEAATATQYTRFESASYSGGTLTAQITTSVSYYDISNNYWWMVTAFAPLANQSVTVQIDEGVSTQYTTDSNGNISITGLSLAHTLTLLPQFFVGTTMPARTSGYITFTV
jgi:hypothetical protein